MRKNKFAFTFYVIKKSVKIKNLIIDFIEYRSKQYPFANYHIYYYFINRHFKQ